MNDNVAQTGNLKRYRWYVLSILLAVSMIHYLDRMVVSLLIEPIRSEFQLSDSQMGLLAGTAFAISFALAGLPMGFLVDRVNRVRLLATVLAVWSGLTAVCSLANSFAALVVTRICIGTAESGGMPTALSLASDYFDRTRRSTAVGIYKMGPPLGTIVGFALTGFIAANYGWRTAFLVAGIPGLILVVVLLCTVREPRRGLSDGLGQHAVQASAPPIKEALQLIAKQPALVHLILGSTVASMVAAGVMVWLPALLMRSYGVSIQTAGFTVAFGVASVGVFASLGSGILADRLDTSSSRHLIPRLSAMGALLAIPAVLCGTLSSIYALAIAGFALNQLAVVIVTTPSYALSLSLAPPQIRGTTTAVLQVLGNLAGFGLGPQLVGILSDAFQPLANTDSLRYALMVFVFLNVWAAAHFLRASQWLRRSPAVQLRSTEALESVATIR